MLVRANGDHEAHLKKDDSQTYCGKPVCQGSVKDLEICLDCMQKVATEEEALAAG